MSTELAKRSDSEVVRVERVGGNIADWDAEQAKLITEVLSPGLNTQELALFAQVCHRTGLDPFTRQIYAIKRNQRQQVDGQWTNKQVMTIQTGIDGYRVIAERTGEYVGGDAPVYGPPCGCALATSTPHPEWAEVTVRRLKNGTAYTTSERADFDEYAQQFSGKLGTMWAKMPKRMIAKCAEALALRRAFPGLFEGVYTTEEMQQADVEPAQLPPAPPANVIDSTTQEVPPQTREERDQIVLAGECPQCRADGLTTRSGKAVKWLEVDGRRRCTGYDPDKPEGEGFVQHDDEIPF